MEDAEIFPGKLACDHHGHMKKLLTGENLISQMSNYYEFLSSNSVTAYGLWTSPYLDSWGLGLMLTYAIPITSKVTGKSVNFYHSSVLIYPVWAETLSFFPGLGGVGVGVGGWEGGWA